MMRYLSSCVWTLMLVKLAAQSLNQYPVVSLKETLRQIQTANLTIKQEYLGPNFKLLNNGNIHFKCDPLFRQVINADAKAKAPCRITPELNSQFTMGGLMVGEHSCPDDSNEIQNGAAGNWTWSFSRIDEYDNEAFDNCGGYGVKICTNAMKKHANMFVKGKVGMILGSQNPWAENGLLHYGAKKIITIEYMKVISEHPKLTAIRPVEVARKFLNRSQERADFIFSYSSLEHDGLGRYGDPIDPFGDLESMARAYCLLKPDGVLFLGVPNGPDMVSGYNHRIYGKYRMSLVLPLWEPVDLVDNYLNLSDTTSHVNDWNNQPIWVLKKKKIPSAHGEVGRGAALRGRV